MGLVAPPSGCDNLIASGGGSGSNVTSVSGTAPNVEITGAATSPIVNAGLKSWEFAGELTTPLTGGVQNNYTTAGLSDCSTLYFLNNPLNPVVLTGIAGGTGGRFLNFHNNSTSLMFITNDDPASSAANRILLPGFTVAGDSYSLSPNQYILFQYDSNLSRWKALPSGVTLVADDGTNIVSVNNAIPSRPIVSFNGVAVDWVTVTGNGTPSSPLTSVSTPTNIQINKTIFVDEQFGDDSTGQIESLTNKFRTFDQALANWSAGFTIHLMPGEYNSSNTFSLSDQMYIYGEMGSRFTVNNTTAFLLDSNSELNINGHIKLVLDEKLFEPRNPSNFPETYKVNVDVFDVTCTNGNILFFDATSGIVSFTTNSCIEGGFLVDGWALVNFMADSWQKNGQVNALLVQDLSNNSGRDYYNLYGPRNITIQGKTKPRLEFKNETQIQNCFFTQAARSEDYKTIINLKINFDSTDGFFFNHGNGTIFHYGDVVSRYSSQVGGPIVWYYLNAQNVENDFKPKFIHVEGSYITGTHPLNNDSQNHHILVSASLEHIELNGSYQNSGIDNGSGALSALYLANSSALPGESKIILNVELKSDGPDASPIAWVDQSNPQHTVDLIFKNTVIETGAQYCITSGLFFNIKVLGSLVSNKNLNPFVTNTLSFQNIFLDEDVKVYVPRYGT